jgi:hypothetical protein
LSIRVLLALTVVAFLGACSTYTTPRYSISADTNVALKSFDATTVGIGNFSGPTSFESFCRGAGPLAPVDGISYYEYIRRALETELKVAGIYTETAPHVVLSGTITRLEFSSSRSITGGSWDIGLTLESSNGRSFSTSEYYTFESGFIADTACKQTAEAFMPAVQDLIGKTVQAPDFRALLQ